MASRRKVIDGVSEEDGTVSRTGRVRKKSSKVLEMEEAKDDIEQAILGKAKKRKSEELEEPMSPEEPEIQEPPQVSPSKKQKTVPSKISEPEPKATNETEKTGKKPASKRPKKSAVTKGAKEEPEPDITPKIEKTPPKRVSTRGKAINFVEVKGETTEEVSQEEESLKLKVNLGDKPSIEKVTEEQSIPTVVEKTVKTRKKTTTTTSAKKDNEGTGKPRLPPGVKEKVKISFEDALASAPLVLPPAPKPVKKKKKEPSEPVKVKDILAAKEKEKAFAEPLVEAVNQETITEEKIETIQDPVIVEEESPLVVNIEGTSDVITEVSSPKKIKATKVKSPLPESTEGPSEGNIEPGEIPVKKKKKKKKKFLLLQKSKKLKNRKLARAMQLGEGQSVHEDDSNSDMLQIVLPHGSAKQKGLKKKLKKVSLLKKGKHLSPEEIILRNGQKELNKALNVMTTKEKKKRGPKGDKSKRKRRPGPTAYMIFCNVYRPKVVTENPDRDFSAISKRLGEIWHGLPEKEKLMYKRKAKRAVAKASKTTAAPHVTNTVGAIFHTAPGTTAKRAKEMLKSMKAMEEMPQFKPPGTDPIDIAAHLKLLGESLSNIGIRLQETRGQIAVQGTIPLLLDSLIVALGPLTALTTQVPELNAITDFTHASTLDNIAYFMPGL